MSDTDADQETDSGSSGEPEFETGRGDSRYAGVPERLKAHDRWICWTTGERNGKTTKKPIDPRNGQFASTTDPDTWASFRTAVDKVENGTVSGIGFVFTENGPFVGVDLDNCRTPETGNQSERAAEIIETLDSYTEVSPSGTGFHVIAIGELPAGRNRHGDIEMYEASRYFTVTGDRVLGTPPDIRRRTAELEEIHGDHLAAGPRERTEDPSTDEQATDASTDQNSSSSISDTELIDRAKAAENGAKFARLWRGSTAGYPSQSEADMALCCLLAFWTGCDHARIDRLFRSSGLLRDKWDEQHFADGSTYGEKTIERAIAVTDEMYEPGAGDGEATSAEAFPTPGDALSVSESDTTSSDENAPERELRRLRKENTLLRDKIQEYAEVIESQDETIRSLRNRSNTRSSDESGAVPSVQAPGQETRARDDDRSAVSTNTAGENPSSESEAGPDTESNGGGLLDRLRSLL